MANIKNHSGKALTKRQSEILEFMGEYFWENQQLPSMRAISNHFGFASSNAAQHHCEMLESKGAIEKNENGKWRFCDLSDVL